MQWYKIPDIDTSGTPFIKKVKAGGKSICLVGYNGEVFALGSRCPHAGEDLSNGWCKEGKLVCRFHRYSYDLTTGKGSPGQNDFVNTYPVKIKNNELYVGVGTFWEKLKAMFTFED